MKTILLHVNPRMIGPNQHGAKALPKSWWQQLISAYPEYKFYQIGLDGDQVLNDVSPKFNLNEEELVELAHKCDHIVTIDSFLPHLLHPYNIQCIVIFTRSDPKHYGYDENINILKDKKYLRPDQFGIWQICPVVEESYPEPKVVIDLIK